MEFPGWKCLVLPFLGWNSLINSLGGTSVEFFTQANLLGGISCFSGALCLCFCLAAGEFFGWNFCDGSLLFHRCLGWNSVGGPCLLSCVGNPLGGISWVEVPCVACSWVEFLDQFDRWNFAVFCREIF